MLSLNYIAGLIIGRIPYYIVLYHLLSVPRAQSTILCKHPYILDCQEGAGEQY